MSDTQDESSGPGSRTSGGGGKERDALPSGTALRQYTIRRKLGQGGMGVVYEADDFTLHRKAAIKLLRQEDADRSSRLLDEARKLAKLSHPNVITVYGADRYRDQVYIAMEFMAGGTLTHWLKGNRSLPDIVKVFLAAGEGLAAAHAAGLVHRDFKPDNVLLDANGVPHVSDFGLADATEGGKAEGRIAGTKGFMAPEQEKGAPIDARADQYAFCVSLYQALYKEMPGASGRTSLRPQSTAILVAVPLWLRNVLKRGLSAAPADRYPSMKALLNALADDPARKRRQRTLTAVTAVSVAALLGLTVWLTTHETDEERGRRLCRERVEAESQKLWSPKRRGPAEAAFQRELASGVWTQVNQHLSDDVKGWTEASLDACRLPLNDANRAPYQACLEERRKMIDSMADLFSTADRGTVSNAISTVMLELTPVSACKPGERKTVVVQPAASAQADPMRSALAKVRVLRAAAKYKPALDLALTVKDEAQDAKDIEIAAEAELAVGELYADQLEDGAEEFLIDAIISAEAIGNDELRARAWIVLLGWSADREKAEQALLAKKEAESILAKLGDRPLLAAELETRKGGYFRRQGDLDAAEGAFARALELRTHVLAADHPLVLHSRENWAVALKPGDARRMKELEAVLEAVKRVFGERHAETTSALMSLARAHLDVRDCEGARSGFGDALNLALDRADDDPRGLGSVYIELAGAYACLKRMREACKYGEMGLQALRSGGASDDETERVEAWLKRLGCDKDGAPALNAGPP